MNVTGPLKALIAASSTANGIFAGRVYPGVLEQESTYPAAAITMIDVNPTNSKTHASTLDIVMVQIDIYGTTYATAAAAAAAIRGALDYKESGSLKHIQFEGQRDMFSMKPELFRIMQEYSIAWK